MSDKIIKESDAIKAIYNLKKTVTKYKDLSYHDGLSDALEAIQDLPSADRPRGKWIGDKCSVCGRVRTWCGWYGLLPNFCPDCGARMRGVDDE